MILTPSQIRRLAKLSVGQTKEVEVKESVHRHHILADFERARYTINAKGRIVYAYIK